MDNNIFVVVRKQKWRKALQNSRWNDDNQTKQEEKNFSILLRAGRYCYDKAGCLWAFRNLFILKLGSSAYPIKPMPALNKHFLLGICVMSQMSSGSLDQFFFRVKVVIFGRMITPSYAAFPISLKASSCACSYKRWVELWELMRDLRTHANWLLDVYRYTSWI